MLMKRFTNLSLLFVLLLSGCDTKENQAGKSGAFNVNAGKQIPLETAMRWIENRKNQIGGRTAEQQGTISASMLRDALNGSDNIGISLHHAVDANGADHILAVTVTKNSTVENPLLNSPSIIDTQANAALDAGTAQNWVANYTGAHPGEIQYYFFGLHIFNEILANPSFNNLEIVAALDEQNEPQQLLFAWNDSGSSGGRTQIGLVVYDLSTKCPPCPADN